MKINKRAPVNAAPKLLWYLPLVDNFKLDAFGLDDSFEASVAAVDIKFELFLKLRTAAVLYCAGFVPLSLLLHTQ